MAVSLRGRTNRCLAQARALLSTCDDDKSLLASAHLHAVHLLLRQAYCGLLSEVLDTYQHQAMPASAADAADILAKKDILTPELQLLQQAENADGVLASVLNEWQDQRPGSNAGSQADRIDIVQVDESKAVFDVAWYQSAVSELQDLMLSIRDMGQQW